MKAYKPAYLKPDFEKNAHSDKILDSTNPVLFMEKVATHRISLQSSKEKHAYPIIRLPKAFRSVVGSSADIFTTEYLGQQAFLVVVGNQVDNLKGYLSKNHANSCENTGKVKIQISKEIAQNQEERGTGGNSSPRCCYGDSNPSRGRERPA